MYIHLARPKRFELHRHARRAQCAVEDLVANLDRAYEVAEKTANPTAMTAAVLGSAHCFPTSR